MNAVADPQPLSPSEKAFSIGEGMHRRLHVDRGFELCAPGACTHLFDSDFGDLTFADVADLFAEAASDHLNKDLSLG